MTPVIEAAIKIQEFCQQEQWRFCIIGGLAVLRWGEPRATRDVDVALLTGLGDEQDYIDKLTSRFAEREPGAARFALEARVLLLDAENGVPLDVTFAWLPYEEKLMERASDFEFAPGQMLHTASLEDLVVLKALAPRPQDETDLEGIIARSDPEIDWNYVEDNLSEMDRILETDEASRRLSEVRQRVRAAFDDPSSL